VFLMIVSINNGFAQCINTFPNTQDFETSATWNTGGINSDWAWGTPSKAVINSAGGGSKCWMIGGLSGSNYNSAEQSYIESPCYDFSTLNAPYVSFKVFWEMEHKYDGASLLYTINNGITWNLVGAFNDPSNCMTQNWYNYGNINYLAWSNTGGWSGNSKPTSGSCQGGSGSLGWLTAKHCLSGLAGKTNVKFRFNFGSGTSCNSFDGFAIDDFTIENASLNTASFTYTCSNFSAITPTCPIPTSYSWNFGESISGANNTSTLSNPSHEYNSSGIYTVSLTTSGGPCGAVATGTQLVSVIGASIASITNVTCFGGNNGSAMAVPLNGSPAFSYTWYPNGGNNQFAQNLSAGNYTVIIKDSKGCVSSNTASIQEPIISTGVSTQTLNNCLGDKTLLQVSTSGITEQINYLWSPGSSTSSSILVSPLISTVYSVNISTSGPCPINQQKIYTVIVNPKPIIASDNSEPTGCAPLCINFKDNSSTYLGTITHNLWSFNNGTTSTLLNTTLCFNEPGNFIGTHMVTNSFGCSASVDSFITITVYPSPTAEFIADNYTVTELNAKVNFSNLSTAINWEWNFGGIEKSTLKNPSYTFNSIGTYPILLTVTNAFGCSHSVTHFVNVLPEFTFFAPDAFTPNGDNLNDVFLPMGMGWNIETYELCIYDRWGQKIFKTHNHNQGWDGTLNKNNDVAPIGVYIYTVVLKDIFNKTHSYTGNISILK